MRSLINGVACGVVFGADKSTGAGDLSGLTAKAQAGATGAEAGAEAGKPGEPSVEVKKPESDTIMVPRTVTYDNWGAAAGEVEVTLNGQTFVAECKEFSSGSRGWYLNGKVYLKTPDGQRFETQIGLNLTVVGSKPDSKAAGKCKLAK